MRKSALVFAVVALAGCQELNRNLNGPTYYPAPGPTVSAPVFLPAAPVAPVPLGEGWFCAGFMAGNGGSLCERFRALCEDSASTMRKAGLSMTDCYSQTAAACYQTRFVLTGEIRTSCHGQIADCLSMRKYTMTYKRVDEAMLTQCFSAK